MADRIRLTITVDPETHAVFTRIANAAGMSLGKTMGDWLADTVDGAQFVATKMEEARSAPRRVMREFQAMGKGLTDEASEVLAGMRMAGAGAGGAAARTGAGRSKPPSSPTGVNTPKTGRGPRS